MLWTTVGYLFGEMLCWKKVQFSLKYQHFSPWFVYRKFIVDIDISDIFNLH